MNNRFSKISLFLFMSILLTSGLGNFMVQEAFAVADITYTAATATTTTITLTWSENVNGAGASTGDWTISTGQAVTSVTHVDGTSTSTLNLGTALATDATPTVTYAENGNILDTATTTDTPVVGGVLATDGIVPVVSSAATTSSTTIALTMSESITNDSALPGDFTIGGVASTPTVTGLVPGLAASGTTITLTLNAAIVNGESPTVTYTLNARVIDDGATGNQLAAFAGQAVTNNVAVVVASTSSGGGGSGCDDCEAPTLGIDKNGKRLVSNGFIYNGNSVDAEIFFTPYPLITANVGKTNTANFKLYENEGISNIRHFTLAFGMDKGDIISDSKAKIELDIDHEGTETVTVTDPENALDSIKVTTSTVSCSDDSFLECLEISIQHRFRAPLDFNIVGTDVWDSKRNAWQNTFNHGIEVVGKSLNPAKEYDGINKGHIYHLTETSKTTAVDLFGNSWTFNYGLWNMDYIDNKNTPVTLFLKEIIPTIDGFAGIDQFGTMYYLTETSKITAVDLFDNNWSLESGLWTMDSIYSEMILDSTPMGGYTRADSEFNIYKYGQILLAENKLNEITVK